MPELPAYQKGDPSYEKIRWPAPEEAGKRGLERMMMAVVIYTKATGSDTVPGYNGSISAPFIKAIIRGTDPKSNGYWGEPLPNDQVGAVLAMAIYIEPKRYWDLLTAKQKDNILQYFKKQVHLKTYDNNHYFFHMIAVALLDDNHYASNREHLTHMYDRLMGWYRGDGWFLDGNNRGFDYYNFWGFQLFNQVLYKFDPKWHDQFGERIKNTTAKFMETLPYFFGRDGGPIPWGRSLSYRFASNAAIAWSFINGMGTLPPGEARRIASGSLKYFWEHGCLAENKLLSIGYWGANAGVAEAYLSYGDPYWANQGLACLLIPATDPFWTAVEAPMPADGAGGKVALPGPQFTIRVSPVDGEARMFPVGQPWGKDRDMWQAGAKYDQQAYSSFLGFCVQGEGGADIGAGRSGYYYDGKTWFYRERAKPILVSPNHLVSQYTLKQNKSADSTALENRDEMVTHTLIGNDGEVHVFWHNYPDPIYLYLGGYGISVQNGNTLEELETKEGILIHGGDYFSVIRPQKLPKENWNLPRWCHAKGGAVPICLAETGHFHFGTAQNRYRPMYPLFFTPMAPATVNQLRAIWKLCNKVIN
jgi:hypothetical protein